MSFTNTTNFAGRPAFNVEYAYTTTVTEVEAGIFGGGTYRIECTCGERVTYAGQAFTQIEAERHQRWHQAAGK